MSAPSIVLLPRQELSTLVDRSRRRPDTVFVIIGDFLPNGRIAQHTTVFARNGRGVTLPRTISVLLLSLAAARGNFLSYIDLGEALWGDRFDGGPDHWQTSLGVARFRAKQALASLGLQIEAFRGWGLRLEDASEHSASPSSFARAADLKPARVGPAPMSISGPAGPATLSSPSDRRLSPASLAATVPSISHVSV